MQLRYAIPGRDSSTRLQQMCELVMARTKYPQLKHVIINPVQVARKDQPKVGEPVILDISPHAFSRFGKDLLYFKSLMDYVKTAFPNPLDRPRSYQCMSRYGLCEFHPLCSQGYEALSQYKRVA